MNKHTPGPWKFGSELMPEVFGDKFHISQQEGAPYTENYSDVATTISGELIEVQEANARLIAAAPDLLVALQDILNEFDNQVTNYGDQPCQSNARAAIAKALGEPHE